MIAQLIHDTLMGTPAMGFLSGLKKEHVFEAIAGNPEFGIYTTGIVCGMRGKKFSTQQSRDFQHMACHIARQAPIEVDPGLLMFFSGTCQGRAEAFVIENPDYNVIHTTLPGALLEMMSLFSENLELTRDQRYEPWNILSARLSWHAEGNVGVTVDIPKRHATFVKEEMPVFLRNDRITTINNEDKRAFWDNLPILDVLPEELPAFKAEILRLNCGL